MKKYIAICLFLTFVLYTHAQNISNQIIPGSLCANITMKDTDGNTHKLYDYLDQGKVVILNIFRGTSSISWNYRQSGALQDFYAAHGPQGDNTAMVFAVGSASLGTLMGFDGDTIGDWLTGTPFPTISSDAPEGGNTAAVLTGFNDGNDPGFSDFNRSYRVCPDRRIYRMGLVSADSLYLGVLDCGSLATAANDAKIIWSEMDTTSGCAGVSRGVKAFLSNYGTTPLTSTDIVVKADNQVLQTYQWSGNLPTYSLDTILLNDVITDGSLTNINIFTRNPNNAADANPTNDTSSYLVYPAVFWDSDSIFVDIQTDGYGHQIYWDIRDGAGITIDSGGNNLVGMFNGNGAPVNISQYEDFTNYTKSVSLAGFNTSCVTIRVLSGEGYGTCCTWGNGHMRFKKGDEIIFDWSDFGRRAYGKLTSTLVATDDAPDLVNLKAYPNPTNGQINIAFSLPQAADVGIEVLNVVGQRMLALPPSRYMSGSQTVPLELLQVPNGMYWAVLRTRQGTEAVKFVIAK